MKIRVRCFTGMRQYAPESGSDFELEVVEGVSIDHLLSRLKVPSDIRPFIAVNGQKTGPEKMLQDGDEVVLFTQMEGG